MDKKSILGVAFGIILLAFWMYQNVQYQKESQKAQALAAAQATPATSATATVATTTPEATSAPATAPEQKQEPAVPEKTQNVGTPLVDYTFTNIGGGIATARLLKHEGGDSGEKMVLNAFGKHPLGALLENPAELNDKAYTVSVSGTQVVCERETPQGIHIKKTFSLPAQAENAPKSAQGYSVGLEVAFSNNGSAPVDLAPYFVYAGAAGPIHSRELPTYTNFGWYRGGNATFIDVNWFNAGKMPVVGVETSPAHATYSQVPGGVNWVGVKNQYFSNILYTEPPAEGAWASPISSQADGAEVKGIQGALQLAGFKLKPGETRQQTFSLYAGPNEYRLLEQLGHGETAMMNKLGWFKWISLGLLGVMNWLHDQLPGHSYAVAIVILTFVVRGALWPVQGAATKSMKRMQLIQPKQMELKEKYKDDPAKMNEEVMKLYKEYKINPFAGCLPMFIQIPIFIGFYSMLGSAVELRNSHFLWVHDLSQPDTVLHLFGVPVNILPLCMAATMVWQMSISPKSGDPAQQKMMMLMPLMFVFFTYNFASALALYYTISNILSIIQLYVTRNQLPPALEQPATAGRSRGKNSGRRQ
jgi:YidC/Oxa1 family membrane protein insertase